MYNSYYDSKSIKHADRLPIESLSFAQKHYRTFYEYYFCLLNFKDIENYDKVKMNKSDIFLTKIKKQYPGEFDYILKAIDSKPPITFRITTAEPTSTIKGLEKLGFSIKSGPLPGSFIVQSHPSDLKLSETLAFENAEIYIQSLSSMVPATMLLPAEGDNIIDLCAAPGSKTIQIAQMVNGKANIIAVETNRNRYFRLQENLRKYGFSDVLVLNDSGVGLEEKYPNYLNYFDKVLVDAPCSNEGLICLSQPQTLERWNPKLSKKISKLQKRLLISGINMLKPGGTLVYSTCTFSKEENEEVTAWLLKKMPEVNLVEEKRIIPDGLFTAFYAAKIQKSY